MMRPFRHVSSARLLFCAVLAVTPLVPSVAAAGTLRLPVGRKTLSGQEPRPPVEDELLPDTANTEKAGGEAPSAERSEDRNTTQDVTRLEREKKALEARLELEALRRKAELAEKRSQIDALNTETELVAARREQQAEQLKAEIASTEAHNARLHARRQELEQQLAIAKAKLDIELQHTDERLQVADARHRLQNRVDSAIQYRENPLVGGVLEITDRRIALNGPITMAVADRVTQRLDFYNNKSSRYPIFIVIDYSPGGSVMAGYRILKAMEASDAPVYVVVKSFAASMAAVITTLAPHSYAYPNAILLHHQLSGNAFGNLTEQREQVREAEEWSHRLMAPLCKKLKMTEQQFVEQMYRHNSQGDWSEFADRAQQLHWVDHVAYEVRERGVVALDARTSDAKSSELREQNDAEGRPYVRLPRLKPFDYWYLYDPDAYFVASRGRSDRDSP